MDSSARRGRRSPEISALVLELVEGETLADRLGRGPLPVAAALDLARQIADALDVAHERGIVHRDLKPANIKITADGAVKLLDFGLAKALANDLDDASVSDPTSSPTITSGDTRAGVVLGTAAYMSPEQARGKAVDKRADVWAFGCVLYEMLAGRRAFAGESITDTLVSVLEREPDWSLLPQSTPHRLGLLIRRCLRRDVERRLRDIADAKIELEDAIAAPELVSLVPSGRRHRGAVHHAPGRRPRSSSPAWPLLRPSAGWRRSGNRWRTLPIFPSISRLVSTPANEFSPGHFARRQMGGVSLRCARSNRYLDQVLAGGDPPVNLTATADIVVQSQDAIGGLAVCPDGSQIAFQAQAPRQLSAGWVIQAPLGGSPRRMLPIGSSGMQWSPDGRRIAYVKTGGPLGDALMVADADGQKQRGEIVKREGARHVHWLRWDPAGAFVYFNHGASTANSEPTEIFRASAAGGPAERVVATTRRAVFPFPSPDGRGLFYAANPDAVDLSLWWRDLSTGKDHRLTTGVGEYSTPSVSADGQRLVGRLFEGRQSLERLAVTFERPVALESPDRTASRRIWILPYSRDGTRAGVQFGTHRPSQSMDRQSDLTLPRPLTSGVAFDERPAFSPDGETVSVSLDRGGQRGIWRISSDGGAPRLIAPANVIDTISWAPDGRRIVFATPVGDAPGLMTMDVTSGQTTRVPTPAAAASPAWSPRDDVIAYVEPRGGTIGAYAKFVTSSGERLFDRNELAQVQVANGAMSWSPDGFASPPCHSPAPLPAPSGSSSPVTARRGSCSI